jgi:hypothetical protein
MPNFMAKVNLAMFENLEWIANAYSNGSFIHQIATQCARNLLGHYPALINGFTRVPDGQSPIDSKKEYT